MLIFTPTEIDGFVAYGPVFDGLLGFSSIVSITGSLTVIVTFLLFPQLRKFFARLAVYLALSDLWLCCAMMMGPSRPPHYTKCMIQSAMNSYFGLATVLWTVAFANSLHRVLLDRDLSVESKYEKNLHIFAWGLPALAVVLTFSTGVAGPAGLTCWIKNTTTGAAVRLITFYLPLWGSIGYSLWVYTQVSTLMQRLVQLHQIDGSSEVDANAWDLQRDLERQRRSVNCLLMIPLILVFCWTPTSIRRFLDIFLPSWTLKPLDYWCAAVIPLQGGLNAIVFGATPAIRDAIFGRLDHSARKLHGIQRRLGQLRPGRRKAAGAKSNAFAKLRSDQPEPQQIGASDPSDGCNPGQEA